MPFEALETRAGETVASGTPDPIQTPPIIDRLFADSVAAQMGGQVINIPFGDREWPVVTSSVAAGWAATETGSVAGPTAFAATDKAMAPDNTLGVQMKETRKALKQSGPAIEQAIRRDMQNAIRVKLDEAAFQGTGTNGEPLGVIAGAATYGITETAISATATYAAFRAAVVWFMTANAANGPKSVSVLLPPEIFDGMDGMWADHRNLHPPPRLAGAGHATERRGMRSALSSASCRECSTRPPRGRWCAKGNATWRNGVCNRWRRRAACRRWRRPKRPALIRQWQ